MPACAEDLNSGSTVQLTTKEKLLLDSYKKNPNNITVNLDLAKLYFNGGIKDKAVFYLNNAKKIDNTNAEVYAIGSDLLFNEGLVREAEIAARKSVAYGEECAYSYIIMGKIYLKKSESPELLNSFFASSKKQRLLTQSKKYFLKALELDETNAQAHIGLSNYYKSTGNDFKRQDELMKAEELDIYNPQTLIFLAEFCIDNARFQKALNYLEKADNFSLTKQYQVHYLMGNIYEKLGDFFKAQHEYYTVLEMKPFDSEVKQRIEQINDVIAGIPSKKVITDEINEANNEEKTVKAYFFIITDRETEARQMLLEVLKDNPDNIKAIQGIAELYYTQWLTGEFTLRNYIADSEYFSSVEDYDKIKIALIKNNIISSQGISQQLKEIISNLSNKFEFDEQNALIDSFRASNLNDDFLNAKKKLDLLLKDGLSDDFVFQLTAYLCFDRNYDLAKETLKIISNSKKYSTWASLISDRIARKLETADKNCETGLENYRKKDYSGAIFVFEQNLKFYSTHKRTRIYYALALNKMGNSQKAIEELKKYIILESIFPSEKPEFKVSDLQKMITTWKK
jgi:Flp pilus assembly protein TadD